jgi:hypothetical protein
MSRFQVPPPPRRKFERHAKDGEFYRPLGTGQSLDERVDPRNTPEARRDYSDADFDQGQKPDVSKDNRDELESDINSVEIHQAESKEKIDHSSQGRTASKDSRDWDWDADVGEGDRSRWHWKESEKDVHVPQARSREDRERRKEGRSREYFSDVRDGHGDRNYSDLKLTHERNDGNETSLHGRHRHHSDREWLPTDSFEEKPGHRKKHKHRKHGH